MSTDSLSFRRSREGSTSAPARKVSTMPANEARKSIHGVEVIPSALPATTPKPISMIATERPISTLIMDAIRIEKPTIVAMSSWSTSTSAKTPFGRGHQPRSAALNGGTHRRPAQCRVFRCLDANTGIAAASARTWVPTQMAMTAGMLRSYAIPSALLPRNQATP
jgi:hypothetical protein